MPEIARPRRNQTTGASAAGPGGEGKEDRAKHRAKSPERAIRAIDRVQKRWKPLAFGYAVVKKFGDDSAGSLASLIAYHGFLSLFPLLLVLITVLGMVVTPSTEHTVIHSALGQFPIVGSQLTGKGGIQALKDRSIPALIIGLLGLIWGSLGVTQAAQRAMSEIWNIPLVNRPGFAARLGRSVAFLGILLVNVVLTTVLAGFSTFGSSGLGARVGAAVLAVLIDAPLFVLGFRVLTPRSIRLRCLVRGAVLASLAWAALELAGTALVSHQLRHTSQIYGYFASILGLIGFLYIAAQVTLYAAELNVVTERRLWPRSLMYPPFTDADIRVLTDIALASRRRQEQRLDVEYPDLADAGASAAGPTAPRRPPPA